MLNLTKLPLPSADVRRIQSWLGADGHRQFMDYLATRAAEADVAAANALTASELNRHEEASAKADESVFYARMIEFINRCRETDHQFFHVVIKPQPTTEPT